MTKHGVGEIAYQHFCGGRTFGVIEEIRGTRAKCVSLDSASRFTVNLAARSAGVLDSATVRESYFARCTA